MLVYYTWVSDNTTDAGANAVRMTTGGLTTSAAAVDLSAAPEPVRVCEHIWKANGCRLSIPDPHEGRQCPGCGTYLCPVCLMAPHHVPCAVAGELVHGRRRYA